MFCVAEKSKSKEKKKRIKNVLKEAVNPDNGF